MFMLLGTLRVGYCGHYGNMLYHLSCLYLGERKGEKWRFNWIIRWEESLSVSQYYKLYRSPT